MTMNIGSTDRIIRALVGIAILSLVLILEGDLRWWGLIGIFPLITAAIGYCPPYTWLGIDTRGARENAASREWSRECCHRED